jgi:8-oxo-dGTP pyrophosphatase MutT (NUDIX family)
MTMTNADPERPFRQTGWPGLRAKLFHLYFVLRRPMTLGVRGLVYRRDMDSVFLIRHTYTPGWQLPGGGVETGETMLEALARELAEEGNIVVTSQPVLKSVHFNRRASRRDHVALYFVEHFEQPSPKKPDHEIAESGFFPLDLLPEGTTPATRQRIREVLGDAAPSQDW